MALDWESLGLSCRRSACCKTYSLPLVVLCLQIQVGNVCVVPPRCQHETFRSQVLLFFKLMGILEIHSIVTGEVITSLDTDDFGSEEGPTGLNIKERLRELLHISSFRQKLLVEDEAVDDDITWSSLGCPAYMQVVLLEFVNGAEEELLNAAQQGDFAEAQRCLKAPQEPNCQDTHGETPLCKASRRGDVEMLELLQRAGADANLKSIRSSPLIEAATEGHAEAVQHLLAARAQVDAVSNGRTVLHAAAARGHLQCLQVLLEASADVNQKNSNQATVLHLAAQNGHRHVLQYLLDAGVDKHAKNVVGATALHIAAERKHPEVVRYLARSGISLTAGNQVNATALHIAAEKGYVEVIHAMLQSLQLGNGESGDDPDEVASLSTGPATEALTELLNAKNMNGATALHIVAERGTLQVVECLLEAGIDKDAVNNCNATALHLAAGNGLLRIVQWLVEAQADVNVRSDAGNTPLINGAASGDPAIVKCLLEAGADKNAKNLKGDTAYTRAAVPGVISVLDAAEGAA